MASIGDIIFQRNMPYAKPGPWLTQLDPGSEFGFQQWANRVRGPLSMDEMMSPMYDMRGFWQSGGQHRPGAHFPDMYKTPQHPSFSAESRYATPNNPFQWIGEMLTNTNTMQPVPTIDDLMRLRR